MENSIQPINRISANDNVSTKRKLNYESIAKRIAKASIVPIGIYVFSKYSGYDSRKTTKVTIIGSVIIYSLIAFNTLSGVTTGRTFLQKTFNLKRKPVIYQNQSI
jgi:hypothetical protein